MLITKPVVVVVAVVTPGEKLAVTVSGYFRITTPEPPAPPLPPPPPPPPPPVLAVPFDSVEPPFAPPPRPPVPLEPDVRPPPPPPAR